MIRPLFAPMDTFVRKGLDALPAALDAALPQNAAQRRELPYACRDLSLLLTSDRKQRDRPYWASPRLTAAYLRYFLPWNLVRLASLLPSLPLEQSPDQPLIVDMGSGPLTFPLALWLARPELRAKPVTVLCTDLSPHALNLGKLVFTSLTTKLSAQAKEPCPPWTIHTLRTPLTKALRQVRGRPWLITMGNVLNELEDSRPGKDGHIEAALSRLLDDADRLLLPEGYLLTVEPGTRQGGRMISTLRAQALTPTRKEGYDDDDTDYDDDNNDDFNDNAYDLSHGYDKAGQNTLNNRHAPDARKEFTAVAPGEPTPFQPLAPCTHCHMCPMTGRGTGQWCHVNSPVAQAPAFLRTLSQQAGMDKESVSLSFLLLSRNAAAPLPTQYHWARLISEPFVLPGYQGRARYACTDQGLALVVDCAYVAPGSLTPVEPLPTQGKALRDHKSNALLVTLPGRAPQNPQTGQGENAPHLRPGLRPSQRATDQSHEHGYGQSQPRVKDTPAEGRQRPAPVPNKPQDAQPDMQAEKTQSKRPTPQPSTAGPAPARPNQDQKTKAKKPKKSHSVPQKPFWA